MNMFVSFLEKFCFFLWEYLEFQADLSGLHTSVSKLLWPVWAAAWLQTACVWMSSLRKKPFWASLTVWYFSSNPFFFLFISLGSFQENMLYSASLFSQPESWRRGGFVCLNCIFSCLLLWNNNLLDLVWEGFYFVGSVDCRELAAVMSSHWCSTDQLSIKHCGSFCDVFILMFQVLAQMESLPAILILFIFKLPPKNATF